MSEQSITLQETEAVLAALTEIDPAELSPEVRAQYETMLQEAIRTSVDKRDAVAGKIFSLGQRAAVKRAAADAYIQKGRELKESAERYERDIDRLKEYVLTVMRELPKPKKGPRVLEGVTATFKAKGVADSVEITDEAALPDYLKTATVTLSIEQWREVQERMANPLTINYPDWAEFETMVPVWGRMPLAEIKTALQQTVECPTCHGTGGEMFDGREVECGDCSDGTVPFTIPGARLVSGKLRLEIS